MSRRNSYSGKFTLSKSEFLSAKYYALRYKEWRTEWETMTDTVRAITYDGDMVQSSGTGSPTEQLAIRRAELTHKIRIIEETAEETEPAMSKHILLYVTEEDMTFEKLKRISGIPCGKNLFYHLRRKYYYLLAKKL